MTIRTRDLVLLAFAVALTGCSDDSIGPDSPEGIETDLTEPEAVIASHEAALNARDFDAYVALLDPRFRFHVLDLDAQGFPWLPLDSWPRDVEIAMVGHLMDPAYAGSELPVDRLTARFEVLESTVGGGGAMEVTADALFEVLVGPNDGWASDTRFTFHLAPDEDGYLRIRDLHEIEKLQPRSDEGAIDPKTWGEIKSIYRGSGGFETNLTSSEDVLEAHARALRERDFLAYVALLDPEFQFHVSSGDLSEFPWLPMDYWPYEQEAAMIANMMDEFFSGPELPVESMEAGFVILSVRNVEGGVVEVVADALMTVLVGPNDGWTSETRFVFDLVPDGDGFLRVRTIREVQRLRPGGVASVEGSSWGQIKALYR